MCEDILRETSLCDDIQTVIALPEEVPESSPCKGLDDYLAEKQLSYQHIIKQMREEIENIDVSINHEFQQIIDVARSELDLINKEIDFSMLSDMEHAHQWIALYDKNKSRIPRIYSVITEAHSDLKYLENSRSENIVKILSTYQEQATALRVVGIESIKEMFINDFNNINKNTLKQLKLFEDGKFCLEVTGKEIIDHSNEMLTAIAKNIADKEAHNIWLKLESKKNKSLIFETVYDLTQENLKARDNFLQVTNRLVGSLSELQDVLKPPDDVEFLEDFWEDWATGLYAKLEGLDSLCKHVEGLLKTAIAALLETFDIKINALTSNLMQTLQLSQKEENGLALELSSELEKLKDHQAEELQYLQTTWKPIINALNQTIKNTKTFIKDLTFIWNSHLSRVNKVRTDLETDLEDLYKMCLAHEKDANNKIITITKDMREAKDTNKLNSQSDVLERVYDVLIEKLEDVYEQQLELVDIIKLKEVDKVIQEIQDQINAFMTKHPKDQLLKQENKLIFESSGSEIDSEVLKCNTYMLAVDNRMVGMYEFLERYANVCERIVRLECEDWLNMYIEEIVDRYEEHLQSLNQAQKDSVEGIKQIRVAELALHSERLREHVSGGMKLMDQLTRESEDVKSNQETKLAAFLENLARIDNQNMPETPCDVRAVIDELEREWGNLAITLQDNISSAKEHCENKFDLFKQSCSAYSKTAKGFKNGGNYSPEELTTLNKELKLIEKNMTNQKKVIINRYNVLSKGIKIPGLAEQVIRRLEDHFNVLSLQINIKETLDKTRMRLRTYVDRAEALETPLTAMIASLDHHTRPSKQLLLINDITNAASLVHDYIKFPDGLSPSCLIEEEDQPDVFTRNNSKSEKLNGKTVNPSIRTLFQYSSVTFQNEPTEFLGLVKTLLISKWNDLENSINRTFKKDQINTPNSKKTSSKKKDLNNELDYDLGSELLYQVKTILQSYDVECEITWINKTNVFLKQISILRNVANSLVKHDFELMATSYMNRLDSLEKQYNYNAKTLETQGSLERDNIEQRLLLPLAHPSHLHKLNQFIHQSHQTCDSQKLMFENLVNKYKIDLQNNHDEYSKQIFSIIRHYRNIQLILFDDTPFDALLTNLKSLTNVHLLYDTDNEEYIEENIRFMYPKSIWDDTDSKVKCRAPFPITSRPLEAYTKICILENIPEIAVNVQMLAAENLKASTLKIQSLYDKAVKEKTDFDDDVATWLKQFEHKVNETKLIFTEHCTVKK